jgi:phosphinothricin acetyltransferase
VIVRLAAAADARGVAAIYAPIVASTAISFEVDPPDAAEMERRIVGILPSLPWLVAEDDGDVIGYAYACKHRERAAYRWSVDVATYVDPRRHRRGVARALYRALLDIVRAQGYYAAHAGITLPNDASVGLHESLGFRPVGVYRAVGHKLGAWRDVGWWQLPLRERIGQPALPRSLSELQAAPEWKSILAQ